MRRAHIIALFALSCDGGDPSSPSSAPTQAAVVPTPAKVAEPPSDGLRSAESAFPGETSLATKTKIPPPTTLRRPEDTRLAPEETTTPTKPSDEPKYRPAESGENPKGKVETSHQDTTSDASRSSVPSADVVKSSSGKTRPRAPSTKSRGASNRASNRVRAPSNRSAQGSSRASKRGSTRRRASRKLTPTGYVVPDCNLQEVPWMQAKYGAIDPDLDGFDPSEVNYVDFDRDGRDEVVVTLEEDVSTYANQFGMINLISSCWCSN